MTEEMNMILSSEDAQGYLHDKIRELELRVKAQEEFIKALSDEEIELLKSFRTFKNVLRKDGQVFKWQTRREAK